MPRSTPRSAARSTPLFAGFHRCLFGAPPRSALEKLLPPEETLRGASQLRSACGDLVPDHLLPKAPSHANSRQRLFTPLVTFWAFLAQVLAGSSCREAVRGLLAHLPIRPLNDALEACSANTAAYCRARARLPLAMLEKIFTALGTRLTSETPGLDILRCLRPSMVEKEMLLHAIAYNLVRALMQRAAITHHQPVERISFKGTLGTLNKFAAAMHAVAAQPRKHAAVLAHCLHVIAADPLPDRPDRVEPRAVKRRPKAFDKLQVPRHQTKAKKSRSAPTPSGQDHLKLAPFGFSRKSRRLVENVQHFCVSRGCYACGWLKPGLRAKALRMKAPRRYVVQALAECR